MPKKDNWRNVGAPTHQSVERRFLKKGPTGLAVPRGFKGIKLGPASKGKSYRKMWEEADTDLSFEDWLKEMM